MSRTIRLSRVHALNWYGYKDTIPVSGNLLIAGVTGSGKSILMDLIQFVLVGDQRLVRFNQSATGDRSQRTLKGYCLGDTKEEENGITQYMRQSAITYVALEFIWPSKKTVETWGIRIEFTSSAEMQGRITPFFVPASLDRSDFLDSAKRPLEYSAFKAFIEESEGRVYSEGLDAYLRDMAQPTHLNFERSLLRSLLPTAMSFTFLRSFNEFCRQFILPTDKLDVTDVTASYRTFLAYERELKNLNDQFEKLKEICDIFARLVDLRRRAAVSRYLEAEMSLEYVMQLLEAEESEFNQVKASCDAEIERLKVLDKELPEFRTEIDRLKSAIDATPEGQLYNELNSQFTEKARSVAALMPIGSTVGQALAHRIRTAREWINLLAGLTLDLAPEIVSSVERALRAVEEGGVQGAEETLAVLSEKARAAAAEVSRVANPHLVKIGDIRRQLASLGREIAALKMGKLPFPTRLLDALNSRLSSRGPESPAQHLRELCEVSDERWRPAIEVAFTRKFAIVVAPEHYDQAEKVYYGLAASDLGGEAGRESLINPAKAIRLAKAVKSGSLAEKITSSHPVARAIVSQSFGDLICVENREELRNHDFAVLPDGFMVRGAFIERRRFYDGLPFVGKRGLEQQLAWKEKQVGEFQAEERRLQPIEDAVNRTGSGCEALGVAPDLQRDLARASELPRLQTELQAITARIEAIDKGSFEGLANRRRELDARVQELEGEQRRLIGSPKRTRVLTLEESLKTRRKEVERLKEDFERARHETDVSIWLTYLQEFRSDIVGRFPAKDVAARQCGGIFNDADRQAIAALGDLKGKRRELALIHPKFQELLADAESNEAYDKQLSKLEESEIPEYKQKAHRERKNWEELFRTQVLEKLHSALESVRNLLFFLNNSLKQHPIGNSRYQVHYRQNPDFKIYHDLVEANALARPGELFFASAEPRFRDAIERFLALLVDSADSIEAVRLLDYRQYYEYDMEVVEEDGRKTSVDRHSGKFSGGENQSPYFIAILASYLRAYRRYASRRQEPSLGLVPIDEAFSKLSGERIKDCLQAIKAFDLQGVFSMSTGNIPYAFEHCDSLVVVSKDERRVGRRTEIRNIPVSLTCQSEEAQRIMGSPSRGKNVKVVATT